MKSGQLAVVLVAVLLAAGCGALHEPGQMLRLPVIASGVQLVVADTALPEATATATPAQVVTPTPTCTPFAERTPTPTPRRLVIVLDPGHTRETIGAVSADGALAEHELTLALADKLAPMLEQRGFTVYRTRRADGSMTLPINDENGNGMLDDWEYLQPRTDLANLVGADLLVSLHFNGSLDSMQSGSSVYYAAVGAYVSESERVATLMQRSLVDGMSRSGYDVADLGPLSDVGLKPYGTLYSLGQNPQFARQGRWPGVVIEPLFLTNDEDAAYLMRPDALDVIARACVQAISRYYHGERSQQGLAAE